MVSLVFFKIRTGFYFSKPIKLVFKDIFKNFSYVFVNIFTSIGNIA